MATHAQSTQADLEARLLHTPLLLRGLWAKDKLHFDAAGQLTDSSATLSPMLSAIEIDRVELQSKHLLLKGQRMAIVYVGRQPERRTMKETIQLDLDRPASGDYGASLDAVLATDYPALAQAAPDYWKPFLLHSSEAKFEHPPKNAQPTDADEPIARIGGGVAPPRLIRRAEPEYSELARKWKITANVLVNLQVSSKGEVVHPHIVRAGGAGLDEQAIAAVLQYHFEPAMKDGTPVAVEIDVDINFRIF